MPNTINLALNTPNTGDFPGAWGTTAVNGNMQVIDGISCGVVSVALTNANVSLSIATGSIGTGSITPGAGPAQSANMLVKFSGTLTGNCVITFPRPGHWIVKNDCTVGGFYVQARGVGTGNVIGIPPGAAVRIWNDGTNVDFDSLGVTGSYMDLAVSTTPAWMSACTVLPFLPCVGTATYSASVYPALAAMLGSTFGGNGITTFGVPDKSNRVGVSLGTRLTTATCGIDGNTLGAAGGTAAVAITTSHLPASIPYTDSGHFHSVPALTFNETISVGSTPMTLPGANYTTGIATTNITINPSSPNTAFAIVQPTIIDRISFIRT